VNRLKWLGVIFALGLMACDDSGNDDSNVVLGSKLSYDGGADKILVELTRNLKGGETLHSRVRSLAEGDSLDCASMIAGIPQLAIKKTDRTFVGPNATPDMFVVPAAAESQLLETQESYQLRLAQTYFVDVCIVEGGVVKHQARYDIQQALDVAGKGDGKFDANDDGVKIVSNQAYAEACINEMGDIPFFGARISENGEPDWDTVDCTEIGTPIPSTLDGVPLDKMSPECDNPQTIYSHCEPDARSGANGPRVASARNEQGTHWVLLCRKTQTKVGRYNDVAMIGTNPFTGQSCFFQNQLPFGENTQASSDGMKIPHPADNVSSEKSPQMWSEFWGKIEGGIGQSAGINCQGCHSTDAFIHTPWIDAAVDENGNPIVPKMGQNPDFVKGYNGPYKLIDAADQGWSEPKHLVSEEASACTSCHRIGLDQWTAPSSISSRDNVDGGCVFCGQAPWLDRLEGSDGTWERLVTESHKKFEYTFWMPPNAKEVLNEDLWVDSDYKKAMDFIKDCAANPTQEQCKWESLPKQPGDPTELPVIEETGEELAKAALTILGAPMEIDGVRIEATRRCAECHAVSKQGFTEWNTRTKEAVEAGLDMFSNPDELAQEDALRIVNHMRKGDDKSVFAAAKIGVLAAGAQFPYFQKLFQKAYGSDWGIQYGSFLQRVSMPKGSHPPMSAIEFATIQKWFVQENAAHMKDLVFEVPPPSTCEEVVSRYNVPTASPWLATHIENMAFDGWSARNTEAGINMFGCPSEDPLGCFAGKDQPDYLAATDGTRIVTVRDLGFDTSFWMRSSADGRFIGNGGRGSDVSGFGATITDMITGKNIGVKGSYDPGFFPNNLGFIMQGGGAGLCGQSVLTRDDATADGIDFTEEGCSFAQGINLYQHVAVSTDGGDYFVINSQFTSDSGNGSSDPSAPFSDTSTMKFSPLVFDGQKWTQKEAVIVNSPYEGDSVLSPSGKMVVSRFAGPGGVSLGHMYRRVEATPSGGTYDISIGQPVFFECSGGAKSNISFNERFSVTHRYEGGTANIYVTDLLTGNVVKVTNMPANKKALFPHFRSDGWIYFLATGEGGDQAMATDAALRMAQ